MVFDVYFISDKQQPNPCRHKEWVNGKGIHLGKHSRIVFFFFLQQGAVVASLHIQLIRRHPSYMDEVHAPDLYMYINKGKAKSKNIFFMFNHQKMKDKIGKTFFVSQWRNSMEKEKPKGNNQRYNKCIFVIGHVSHSWC